MKLTTFNTDKIFFKTTVVKTSNALPAMSYHHLHMAKKNKKKHHVLAQTWT